MSEIAFVLLSITYYIISVGILILLLVMIFRRRKRAFSNEINNLERDKNLIISASIISELGKVEALLNNEQMQQAFEEWQNRFKDIKDKDVPKITDQMIEIEGLFYSKKYKELREKIAKVELNIFHVRTKANFLLEEIKEITLSKERNRDIITKLKTTYRGLLTKYNNNQNDYVEIKGALELQFENVDKLFSAFEMAVENNAYSEISKIVKGIDDIVGNLEIIIEEAPSIILMGKNLIPTKIKDIKNIYKSMVKENYNLEYLNLDYNITESEKKIADIFSRLNVLNVEDSIFELKTIVDYFDGVYNDFDNERIAKKFYEEGMRAVLVKVVKLQKINKELYKRIADIRVSYDLSSEEIADVESIKTDLAEIKDDYDKLTEVHRSKVASFSKLSKELEFLKVKLGAVEDKLEIALKTFGSLREDESRAREQLDEIKELLKQTKLKITTFKLPVIPRKYYTELSEATAAIKEINNELDKKPISIRVLNTRVDTARDLVLKLYATTKETIKTAWMAEMAIVYGNRYRPVNKDIDLGLIKAETAFYKGNYKNSLENAIGAINIIEPGIHKRLIEFYES